MLIRAIVFASMLEYHENMENMKTQATICCNSLIVSVKPFAPLLKVFMISP